MYRGGWPLEGVARMLGWMRRGGESPHSIKGESEAIGGGAEHLGPSIFRSCGVCAYAIPSSGYVASSIIYISDDDDGDEVMEFSPTPPPQPHLRKVPLLRERSEASVSRISTPLVPSGRIHSQNLDSISVGVPKSKEGGPQRPVIGRQISLDLSMLSTSSVFLSMLTTVFLSAIDDDPGYSPYYSNSPVIVEDTIRTSANRWKKLPKLDRRQRALCRRMAAMGLTKSAIARHFAVGYSSAYSAVLNNYNQPDNEESDGDHLSRGDKKRYPQVRNLCNVCILEILFRPPEGYHKGGRGQ